jgi:hypothetical protein
MGLLGDGHNGSVVDPAAMLDSGIPKLTARLLEMGLLVAFGTTRDRGALSISVTHNGEYDREYFRRSDDAVEWLERICGAAEALGLAGERPQGRTVPIASRRRQKLA